MNQILPGIWKDGRRLFTRNLVPGKKRFREWVPNRSKPAAAIINGLKTLPVIKDAKILYLGLANSTTASHFSDIIGKNGVIYGVEISERSLRDSLEIAQKRKNIVPILGNAKKPEEYGWVEKVDVVYEDVASDDQSEILIRNAERFLKPNGFAVIAIKARSIDVVKKPGDIYRQEIRKLEKHFRIIEKVKLDPYEKDHMMIIMKI